VAQTANIGSSTSVSSGAAKIFREFKWGLLTLFILMAVVVGLVYDGGRNKKKTDAAQTAPATNLDTALNGATNTGASGTESAGASQLGNPAGSSSGPAANPLGGTTSSLGERASTDTTRAGGNTNDPADGTWDPRPLGDQAMIRPRSGSGANGRGNLRLPEPGTAGDDGSHGVTAEGGMIKSARKQNEHSTEARSAEQTASNGGGAKIYVVKAGDNLTKIASTNQLGKNGIKAILEANKETLSDANKLREGMKLKIPSAVPASADSGKHGTPVASTHGSEPSKSTEHHSSGTSLQSQEDYTVQSGDTLERIARRVLNDGRKWKDLLEWNKDKLSDPSKLRVGMIIHIHGSAGMPASTENIHGPGRTIRAEAVPPPQPSDLKEQPAVPDGETIAITPVSANHNVEKKTAVTSPDPVPVIRDYIIPPETPNVP
jgi:nucleoid-associated protein YgaU